MDHQRAVEAQLPERYAFGELPDNERDEFEEHLADCAACMQNVNVAMAFAANAIAFFRNQATAPSLGSAASGNRFAWPWGGHALALSGAFNLALAALVLYGFLGPLPRDRSKLRIVEAPRFSDEFAVPGAARSAPSVFPVKQDSSPGFRLDLPPGFTFDAYECTVKSVAAETEKTYNLHVTGHTETINLIVPVVGFAPGDYEIRMRGVQSSQSKLLANFIVRVTRDK